MCFYSLVSLVHKHNNTCQKTSGDALIRNIKTWREDNISLQKLAGLHAGLLQFWIADRFRYIADLRSEGRR